MSDRGEDQPQDKDLPDVEPVGAGRRVLMLGALSASAVVTIRPALAATAGSVLTCQIPVPDSNPGTRWIAGDGSVVAPNTPGAFPGAPGAFTGEQVRVAMQPGGRLPGTTDAQSRAYMNYIGRLQRGTSGFTCYASLQAPRR